MWTYSDFGRLARDDNGRPWASRSLSAITPSPVAGAVADADADADVRSTKVELKIGKSAALRHFRAAGKLLENASNSIITVDQKIR